MPTRRDLLKGLLAGFTMSIVPWPAGGSPAIRHMEGPERLILQGWYSACWPENSDEPKTYWLVMDFSRETATFYREKP